MAKRVANYMKWLYEEDVHELFHRPMYTRLHSSRLEGKPLLFKFVSPHHNYYVSPWTEYNSFGVEDLVDHEGVYVVFAQKRSARKRAPGSVADIVSPTPPPKHPFEHGQIVYSLYAFPYNYKALKTGSGKNVFDGVHTLPFRMEPTDDGEMEYAINEDGTTDPPIPDVPNTMET